MVISMMFSYARRWNQDELLRRRDRAADGKRARRKGYEGEGRSTKRRVEWSESESGTLKWNEENEASRKRVSERSLRKRRMLPPIEENLLAKDTKTFWMRMIPKDTKTFWIQTARSATGLRSPPPLISHSQIKYPPLLSASAASTVHRA